ncbi:MAG: hypothetical protein II816_04760 [Elusimicrobia bacterium]|nr:hypothetical protein [Elusimicrobiota bacterium]
MKKNKILFLILSLFCMVSFISCDRYPVEAIVGLGSPIKSWPDPWYIYDDQINTRGSMEPYVWKDDPYCATWSYAAVNFSWTNNVKRGNKCMYFTYIGNSSDTSGATYFGFGLMAREVLGEKIALGKAGYNNMRFWIRGSLNENCNFVIEIPGTAVKRTVTSAEITSEWQEIVVPMSSIILTDEVEFDIAFSLAAIDGTIPTNGGTVYLDDITFEK